MTAELIVFVRIGLYVAAGYLVRGGWLPDDVASMLTSPETVEAVTGAILGAAALAWYLASEARRKLLR